MDLVSTKRQSVTKQGRLGPGKSKATVKDRRIKSAVGQYWKERTSLREIPHVLFRPCAVHKYEYIDHIRLRLSD